MSPTKSEELYPVGTSFSGHPILGVQEIGIFVSEGGITKVETRLFFSGHWPHEGSLIIGLSGPETTKDVTTLLRTNGTILGIT